MALVQPHQDHHHDPRSTNSKFQRKTIQTIAAVSIFSGMLLFLFSSLLVPFCFHSLKSFRFSAYFMELQPLGFNPSKINMFMLCNGILFVLAGSSGLMETGRSGVAPSGPQAARKDPQFSGQGRDIPSDLTEKSRTTDAEEKLPVAVRGEFLIQRVEIQEQGRELALTVASYDNDDEIEDELALTVASHKDDEIEDELSIDECLVIEQAMQEQSREIRMITDRAVTDHDNGDDDEAHGELSLEELNRKCEEFIKKMKGELCC